MTTYSKAMTMVAAVALGCATASIWNQVKMQRQLVALTASNSRMEEATQPVEELDDKVKKEIADAAEKQRANATESDAQNSVPPQMAVEKVKYNDDDELRIEFSQRPDMDVVREYVTVEPLNSGVITFRYSTPSGYHPATDDYIPTLTVSGDFAHRTNVVLRIRKGFPVHGAVAAGEYAPAPLAEDFLYEFKRKDRDPHVDFADRGRYLPPMGSRAMAIASVNVPKVEVEIRKVPAENVVFALALEEDEYSRIDKNWARSESVRDEFFRDLAGSPVLKTIETVNEINKDEKNAVAIETGEALPGGSEPNGLYLVRTSIAGVERDDSSWWTSGKNQYRFRLVCVSDLGLSVRRICKDSLLVWLNSFSTGLPVEDAEILVYSTANVLVAKGRTGSEGLCRPDRIAAGEPFAVVARTADGTDATFIALRSSMSVDETYPDGARERYLKPNEATAFVWSERGIYRHDEPIFLHALLRNGDGVAMPPMPVEIRLCNPSGNINKRETLMTDSCGALYTDAFSVGADQPSGTWTLSLWTPGEKGVKLGEREVKIEEFAPPQIRVRTDAESMAPQDFEFAVTAEHLYGGAAKGLICEGAVVFEDAEFAPADWKGYRFGNDDRGLKPSFRRLKKDKLDDTGRHVFKAPLWESSGLPKAAVRATGQGTVFEDGGRPASTRKSVICHLYPYYIGTTLKSWMGKPEIGYPQIDIACVLPNGRRVLDPKRLMAKLERIDSVYAYRKRVSDDEGWATWDCERVRTVIADKISVPTPPDGDTVLTLPIRDSGDYALTINDLESDASFAMTFYLSDGGDEGVRAPLANPTAVSVAPDKAFYRVGETPRIIVKSPFAGTALITAVRDALVWREVVALTNATTEITLPTTALSWAPNVDVQVSVVQAVKPGDGRFAVRAHGETTIVVRPEEREIAVNVDSRVEMLPEGGAVVCVDIKTGTIPEGNAVAVVTVVDEGINLLTDEKLPDPVAYFSQKRTANHPLFDLYHRLLPVLDTDKLTVSGVKTGGGFGAEMLSRVSPVPSRRFKPLAQWVEDVEIRNNEDGGGASGFAQIPLPEFVGEIRVTAVAYTPTAAGSACVHSKVAPKIVAQPDAPRFAAPGDEFIVTLPLSNRSAEDGKATVGYSLEVSGPLELINDGKQGGAVFLAKDESTIVNLRVKATGVGEGDLKFTVVGLGETHVKTLHLPIRPAAPWHETAGVDVLAPGETKVYDALSPFARRDFAISGSRLSELRAALEWLADYPHGCLEQTSSRIFPLISAGGILESQMPSSQTSQTSQTLQTFIVAGVRRVESMIRYRDFVMWPDCDYAPWDKEVSLYAAHFLVEAERGGVSLNSAAKPRVMKFLADWSMSTNSTISAYACHTLAIASGTGVGASVKDRMLRLYDRRRELDSLSRSRLARAFTAIDDRPRAHELLSLSAAPQSVKEAAFSLIALLELDPEDERIPLLVLYLTEKRDAATYSWGTTESNAHALLALGEYYRHMGWKGGTPQVSRHDNADGSVRFVNTGDSEAFISWRKLDVPSLDEIQPEETALAISRRILDSDGNVVDLDKIQRGDLVFAEITLKSSETRTYSDLIVEDLFSAAFEPTHGDIAEDTPMPAWVMRTDARDDRMLIYSKNFNLDKDATITYKYTLRVVSAGSFVLPAASAEAMYAPAIHANTATSNITVSTGN